MINRSEYIVCFGYPWSENRIYGGGNIILQFYKEGKKILWINPMPNRGLSISTAFVKNAALGKRISEKIKQQLKLFFKRSKGFYVFSPFYVPFIDNKKVYKLNQFLIYLQVRLICRLLIVRNPIICTMGSNDNVRLIRDLGYSCWFHHAGDLYHDLRDATPQQKEFLYKRESKIFNNCDVIFVASWVMVEKVKSMVTKQDKVKYFPHGSDVSNFTKEVVVNPEMIKIKKPIVGYFGSLTNANDQEIYLAIANQGYSLVLIGDILGDYSKCIGNPNIHFFKSVPYHLLPTYAKYFDIGILAWKPAQWINNCNPKKTYEYLALGLPIVSVPIPQLEYELNDFISFASTPSEFIEKIEFELKSDNNEKKKARIERAKSESWENKFANLKQELNEYVRKN